jgi:hypothetical protein
VLVFGCWCSVFGFVFVIGVGVWWLVFGFSFRCFGVGC